MIDLKKLEPGERQWDGEVGAYRAKDGSVSWYIRFRANGRRIVERVENARNITQARDALKVRRGTIVQGVWKPRAKLVTIADYVPTFIADKKGILTVKRYSEQLRLHLLPVFGKKTFDEITVADCKRYFTRRTGAGLAPATVRNELRCLQSVFRSAREDGLTTCDPVSLVRFEINNERKRVLTEDEIKRLLRHAADRQDRMFPIVMLMLCAGLRVSHVCRLRWEEVDMTERVLRTKPDKKGQAIEVPLVPALFDVLVWWREECGSKVWLFPSHWKKLKHATRASLTHQWAELIQLADIEGLWMHDLRRTFTTELRNRGVVGKAARALLGHSSEAMTERYHVPKADVLRAAVESLPFAHDPALIPLMANAGAGRESDSE